MQMSIDAQHDCQSNQERPAWGRGVLAKNDRMTPGRRLDDASKFKLTLRDAMLLLVGCLGMYGAQVANQWGMRSDIRDLKTAFDSYQQRQTETNSVLQRQIDEWRAETKLNRVNISNNENAVAELKGILLGAGIKGIPK
jgi:hypothetical protein